MKKVIINSTGKVGIVKRETKEMGSTLYELIDNDGGKIWNGNFTWWPMGLLTCEDGRRGSRPQPLKVCSYYLSITSTFSD